MTLYVSVTGLTLRSPAFAPLFWWHALRSMAQAKGAPGLVRVDARRIDGVHHTLTIWQDEASMRAYLKAGAHLKAMQAFRRIAAGRTFGCQAETAPDWAEHIVCGKSRAGRFRRKSRGSA